MRMPAIDERVDCLLSSSLFIAVECGLFFYVMTRLLLPFTIIAGFGLVDTCVPPPPSFLLGAVSVIDVMLHSCCYYTYSR